MFMIALQPTELDIARCSHWAYVSTHAARPISEKGQSILMLDATVKCHINQNTATAYAFTA